MEPDILYIGAETKSAQDIGGGEIEITTSGLTVDEIGEYVVEILTNSAITAGAKLTLRLIFNDGSNDFEISYAKEIEIKGNTRFARSSDKIFLWTDGTIEAYIESDTVGDNSVDIEAKLYKVNA